MFKNINKNINSKNDYVSIKQIFNKSQISFIFDLDIYQQVLFEEYDFKIDKKDIDFNEMKYKDKLDLLDYDISVILVKLKKKIKTKKNRIKTNNENIKMLELFKNNISNRNN